MEKSCKQCNATFDITDDDIAFYDAVSPVFNGKKISLPPPDQCPDCRYQQRLTWRNERNLYRRKCAVTGEDIVSIFSPDKSWPPIVKQSYWWSDAWDPREYGRDFDFNRPFFEQWLELFKVVPQLAMNNQQSENCEFSNQSQMNKDCYMVFCTSESRDCMHGMWFQFCENCVDCLYLGRSRYCYEVVNGENCYHCTHSQNLTNCSEVHYSRDCIGCQDCFGCVNLRNKQHHFFNEPSSKEEYHKRVAAMHPQLHSSIAKIEKEVSRQFADAPHKYYVGANIEDSSGNYIMNLRDVRQSFNCREAEHMAYCQDVWRAQNCQDLTETVENTFSYSVEGAAITSNALFCKKFCDLSSSIYCSHCNFSKNLFGCISMKHAQYCVLNKQYTKEEYESLVPRILAHMQKSGEWGKHFPAQSSPYGYNESVAIEYFPLSKEQAIAKGYKWTEYVAPPLEVEKVIRAAELPDSIADFPDDILNWAIECEATGRAFRIIKQELAFYHGQNLPLPHFHPDERHRQRMALRQPRKLWERECMKCAKALLTSFPLESKEVIYCESCYQKAVY